jgi:hypothetical protein
MITNVVNRLKRAYPDLYVSEQFNEYQLILARDGIVTKAVIVNMNEFTNELYAIELSVRIENEKGILVATYNNGSTQFFFTMNEVLYSYDDKKNEKKLIAITEHQLYEFLGGNVLDWIKHKFKMPYKVQKMIEEMVILQ